VVLKWKASMRERSMLGWATPGTRSRTQLQLEYCVPTDGTRAASVGTGDFGTSPIFVQLSDKLLLVSTLLVGVSERKAQWRIDKLCADPNSSGAVLVEAGLNKYAPSLHRLDPNALCARTACVVRAA
jgi:hypothetical protein